MSRDRDDFTASDIARWLGPQPEPAPTSQQDGLGHLGERVLVTIHTLRERHRLRREFEAMACEGDLDRVLVDAQMTRGDVEPMLANYPASAHRLDAVAARLGVTEVLHRDPLAERDMRRVCSVCREQGRCAHWLAASPLEGYRTFCPNAEELEELRHEPN
jgi:hypothetical protein